MKQVVFFVSTGGVNSLIVYASLKMRNSCGVETSGASSFSLDVVPPVSTSVLSGISPLKGVSLFASPSPKITAPKAA